MRTWLNRQRLLIEYTVAALGRRRARSLGLLLTYTAVVFVLASVMLFTHALRQEAARVLAHSPEVVLQHLVAGRHALIPADYLERIPRQRGVREMTPRLWGYFYDPVVQANYTFMATADAPPPGHILIGPAMARARGVAPGNLIAWRAYDGAVHTFTVAGILDAHSELMSADLVLLGEDDFRGFFNYPEGQYTDVAIAVRNPREVRNVATRLSEALPDARLILRDEVLRTYAALFDWRQGIVLAILSGALLAFALLAWDKASGLAAEERREIGILKAIGWETGDVLRMKFWEGALLSGTAFLSSYVLAHVHVFHLHGALFRPVLQGWAVLYPRFALPPEIDPLQVLTLALLTVLPYTVAVLVPCWRAATTDPDAVMRS